MRTLVLIALARGVDVRPLPFEIPTQLGAADQCAVSIHASRTGLIQGCLA